MTVRLDKWLADCGVGTRKNCRALVKRGHVTVDGVVVRDFAFQLPDGARVALDDEPVEQPPVVLLFHKPAGIVSTREDPWGRPDLDSAAADAIDAGLHPVGRLDAETTGLLLFSADGTLTQRLLHPRRAVEKAYIATVEGAPDERLAETVREGVQTADGVMRAARAEVDGDTVRLVVTEGKHRMVRRMLANAGHPVRTLHRTRIGELRLGGLEVGAMRAPTDAETTWLAALKGAPLGRR